MSAKRKTDDIVVIVEETVTTIVERKFVKVDKQTYYDPKTTVNKLLQHGATLISKEPQVEVHQFAYSPVHSHNKLSSTHHLVTKGMVVKETGVAAGKHYRSLKTIKH